MNDEENNSRAGAQKTSGDMNENTRIEVERSKWRYFTVPPSLLRAAGRDKSAECKISAYDLYAELIKRGFGDVLSKPDWGRVNGVPLGPKTFTFSLHELVKGQDGKDYTVSVRLLWDKSLIPENADAIGGRVRALKDALVEIIREHIAPPPKNPSQTDEVERDRQETSREYDRLWGMRPQTDAHMERLLRLDEADKKAFEARRKRKQ